jgi:tetratricopeptide (TPR) repeat protein
MKRSFLKKPLFGLIAPWFAVFITVFVSGDLIPGASSVRSALTIIYFEAVRDYGRAAEAMDQWRISGKPDLEFWQRDVYRSAGMSVMLSGRFDEAADWFGRIVQSRNRITGEHQWDYFALIYRGVCHHKLGRTSKARIDWQQAIHTVPERHDAFVVMGHSRLLEGDIVGAYADYRRALERAGNLGPIYADIGDAWRYINHLTRAHTIYHQGLSVDPTDVFCRLRSGELALEIDNNILYAKQAVMTIKRIMPTLRVVDDLLGAAENWVPGTELDHIPAVRFEPGPAHSWKVAPTRLSFEFFREDWDGW